MPPYPIEILNFGNPDFELHYRVINELNSLQEDFQYVLPPERYKLWAAPFERTEYGTDYIWDLLREYRQSCKGFHPFIIALVHGYLSSERLGNLFGSHKAKKEGFAVVTTYDWEEHFAPPSLAVHLAYYFIRFTMSFICPEIKSHEETRECFFDKKISKADIKLSMKSGKICDNCRSIFEKSIDGHTYNSLTKLIQFLKNKSTDEKIPLKKPSVFIGSSFEGHNIAEYIQINLERYVESTIWSQGVFGLSEGNLESLVKALPQFEYAVLVLTPDDLITKRGREGNSPRDNVIFETGLFMGALGRKRTFIVHCRDEQLELPSDLAGVIMAPFDKRADGNLQAALGPVCTKLKTAMKII